MAGMDLTGKKVVHKAFGEGMVLSHEHREDAEDSLRIDFSGTVKEFKYPSAFQGFLSVKDAEDSIGITEDLETLLKSRQQEKENQLKRWEEMSRPVIRKPEKNEREERPAVVQGRIRKIGERGNVAIKSNYNDGGRNRERIGFHGVCSNPVMWNNIEVEKRIWCTQPECMCMQYYQGIVSREAVEDYYIQKGVCIESRMLVDWRASAGTHHNGPRKGMPMKLLKAGKDSLAVLTTRFPGERECDRVIFAAFLIGEDYEGDNREDGYVAAGPGYRISLNEEECRKLLFWNYFANEGDPERPAWASGLHRYLSDIESAQILRDIAEVKKNTKDEAPAADFLKHYCELHRIDMESIPEPKGALRL